MNKQSISITDLLKKLVDNKQYIDVGIGFEKQIGTSRTKLINAINDLKDEGYVLYHVVPPINEDDKVYLVLSKSGLDYPTVRANIKQITRGLTEIEITEAFNECIIKSDIISNDREGK